jgi:peroxiredoxin
VYGVSTQDCEYQQEASDRLRLPFPLLSDEKLEFARSLRLPTFEFDGQTLIKRLTLLVVRGIIEAVCYPVFPPNKDAGVVLEWFRSYQAEPTKDSIVQGPKKVGTAHDEMM